MTAPTLCGWMPGGGEPPCPREAVGGPFCAEHQAQMPDPAILAAEAAAWMDEYR